MEDERVKKVTAEKVLAIARKELGNTESPAGSNRTKYGKWFGLDGYAWCMMFVQWCFDRAGGAKLLPKRTASCGDLMRAAKASGQWVTKNYRPGDIVIYDFPGGSTTDHTGIVEQVTSTGVVAIEGNTSQAGSQSNGGMVCRKVRSYSLIVGAVRPKYEDESQAKAIAALEKLAKLRVINSPEYWKRAVYSGEVKHLNLLLNKAAAKISKAGPRSSTPENGIGALVAAGVIDTPEYWLEHYRDYPSLGALLRALGGAVDAR